MNPTDDPPSDKYFATACKLCGRQDRCQLVSIEISLDSVKIHANAIPICVGCRDQLRKIHRDYEATILAFWSRRPGD